MSTAYPGDLMIATADQHAVFAVTRDLTDTITGKYRVTPWCDWGAASDIYEAAKDPFQPGGTPKTVNGEAVFYMAVRAGNDPGWNGAPEGTLVERTSEPAPESAPKRRRPVHLPLKKAGTGRYVSEDGRFTVVSDLKHRPQWIATIHKILDEDGWLCEPIGEGEMVGRHCSKREAVDTLKRVISEREINTTPIRPWVVLSQGEREVIAHETRKHLSKLRHPGGYGLDDAKSFIEQQVEALGRFDHLEYKEISDYSWSLARFLCPREARDN